MPGGKKCELSYPKPNFLESGGPKSNQANPMHRGIMHKMTQLYKMTTGKKRRQRLGNFRACLFTPHVFYLASAVMLSTLIVFVFIQVKREKNMSVHKDDVNIQRGRAESAHSTES